MIDKSEQTNRIYRDYILSTSERYLHFLRHKLAELETARVVEYEDDHGKDLFINELQLRTLKEITGNVAETLHTQYSELVDGDKEYTPNTRILKGLNRIKYIQGILYGRFPNNFSVQFEKRVLEYYEKQVNKIEGD